MDGIGTPDFMPIKFLTPAYGIMEQNYNELDRTMTDEYYFDENQPRKVRIKISVSAEMSLLTLKKPESYAVGMSSITLSLRHVRIIMD